MSRLIIASAAKFEIAPLIESLSDLGIDFTCINTGVGLTESSIVASRLRDMVAGMDVIFCGTGGIVGAFSQVHIYRAASVELAPFDARNGLSYLLTQFEPRLNFKSLPIDLPEKVVFGSLGVSTGLETSAAAGEPLETIELYGVARAWAPVARSFTAIIASTNATGPAAHAEWTANFKEASTMTAAILSKELHRLGFSPKRS